MLIEHLRFAWRLLAKQPAFAITAVLTLGLAIGANTAVFSLVNAVLLKPLPYPQPDRLALLDRTFRAGSVLSSTGNTGHSGRVWEAVRDHASTVERAVYSDSAPRVNLVVDNRPLSVTQQRVGAGFFGVLGVGPVLGRELLDEEDRAGGPQAAIVSDRLWRTALQSDPGVVGQTILLRGEPHTVVGVMPPDFHGPADADVWTPLRASESGEGGGQNYTILLRLEPGVTWPEAEADVAAVADPALNRRVSDSGAIASHALISLQRGTTLQVRRPLLLLWAAVGLVLLVACVNLAGLLLARAGQRTREIATRLALGGSRRAVVHQMLVESLLLAVIGGALGLALGALGLEALKRLADDVFVEFRGVALDGVVVAATVALTCLTAVVFGIVPAVHTSRLDVQAALVEGGTRAVAGGVGGWPRRLLLVAEVACGVVLLVAAGLLMRTFVHLNSQPPGFDLSNVVTATASLQDARYQTPERVDRLFSETVTRMAALPGVESVAASLGLPYEQLLNIGFRPVGWGDERGPVTNASYVTPEYFRTLRIPIRDGRALASSDTRTSAPVVVVNETFVRMYLKDRRPIGAAIAISNATREIVGVVGDVQQRSGFGDFGPVGRSPIVYMPSSQVSEAFLNLVHMWFSPTWIVRARDNPERLVPALGLAVAATDPLLPLAEVRDLDAVRRASLAQQRLLMVLVGSLGIAAALLVALGIHGLIASLVSERMRELGVRMALGASVEQAMRSVMLPGIALTIAGLILGSGLALGMTGLVRRLVWGVTPTDPLTFAGVAVMLLLVAIVASLVPALRVRRVDPAMLLRE